MLDPELARMNEIEFLDVCTKLIAYRNVNSDVTTFIKAMTYFIEFDFNILWNLSKEIFDLKYKPNKMEIIKILQKQGYNNTEIAKMYGKTKACIGQWVKRTDILLYPRGTEEQELELNKFMSAYRKFSQINITDLI